METITDHAEQAAALLATQFRDKPKLRGLVQAKARQDQAVESALAQLHASSLDTDEGAQLDGLGAIVGEPRQGASDATYRNRIRARVRLNVGSGTAEDMIAIASLLSPPGALVEVVEEFPAAMTVRVLGVRVTAEDGAFLARILRQARAGGVRLITEWGEVDPAQLFRLDAGPGLDSGHLASAA